MNEFDVLIVGSGAGGAACAHGLARSGRRVLVLEKGGKLPLDGSTLDIHRVVKNGEFLSREPWVDGAGRQFAPEEHFNVGGKTKWYGAAVLRFADHEFAPDAAHAALGWPVPPSEIAPWYAAAERLLDVRTFPIEPALARLQSALGQRGWRGVPMPMALSARIASAPDEARHFDGFASVQGFKADAEISLLRPALAAGNVNLRAGAEVAELLASPDSRTRIAGVRLAGGETLRAPIVVLAAGALHSPRILERFVLQQGLVASLPCAAQIGRNLKLHLLTAMVAVGATANRDLIRKTTVFGHDAFPHSSVQPLGFDDELIANLMPRFVPARAARAIAGRSYGLFLQTEDGSHPDNRVHERANGEPVMDYDSARLPAAQAEHEAFTRRLQRDLLGAGHVSFTQRIGLAGTAHACGTLAAGDDPRHSVVDASGAVHGLEGLYVADGSVLPRSSRVNPSLSIFAWGLRLAALLAAVPLVAAAAEPLPHVRSVDSIGITVHDMDRATAFYHDVLTFEKERDTEVSGAAAEHLYGVFGLRLRIVRMRLGDEHIELMQFLAPHGRPDPVDSHANDLWFQHAAIIVSNMDAAYKRLRVANVAHASSGPQRLPDWNTAAGGIEAFYFRDPDDNFLEILAFPPGKGAPKWQAKDRLFLGIDHTAIVVGDTERSLGFYRDTLGLTVAGQSENYGTEQEHLNNIFGARLRITALRAPGGGPGVELLEYLAPRTGRLPPADSNAADDWYWQINMTTGPDGGVARGGASPVADYVVRDPDGHASLLENH
jgi:choline dehydrogenase-like flavoprotein/catechol 2,3-dioxygenase-like lactoylglutathione lyase family enzyme